MSCRQHLSVSGLKPSILRAKGYTIQVEQEPVFWSGGGLFHRLYVIHNTSRPFDLARTWRGTWGRKTQKSRRKVCLPGGRKQTSAGSADNPEPPTESPRLFNGGTTSGESRAPEP